MVTYALHKTQKLQEDGRNCHAREEEASRDTVYPAMAVVMAG